MLFCSMLCYGMAYYALLCYTILGQYIKNLICDVKCLIYFDGGEVHEVNTQFFLVKIVPAQPLPLPLPLPFSEFERNSLFYLTITSSLKSCSICMTLSGLETNSMQFKTNFFVYKQRHMGPFRYIALIHDEGDFQNYMTHMCIRLHKPVSYWLETFPHRMPGLNIMQEKFLLDIIEMKEMIYG